MMTNIIKAWDNYLIFTGELVLIFYNLCRSSLLVSFLLRQPWGCTVCCTSLTLCQGALKKMWKHFLLFSQWTPSWPYIVFCSDSYFLWNNLRKYEKKSLMTLRESDAGDKLYKPYREEQEVNSLQGDPEVEAETQARCQKQQPGLHYHPVTGLCLKQQQHWT